MCEFSVAVLRTCRDLYSIGLDVFKANHFILASSPSSRLPNGLSAHNVCLWSKKLSRFKNYHLRLHFSSKRSPIDDKPGYFITAQTQLENLILHLVSIAYGGSLERPELQRRYKYKLELKSADGYGYRPLSFKIQSMLLMPFAKLCYPYQHCAVSGLVDPDLAQTMISKLMPTTHSLRFMCRELFNLMKYYQSQGDALLALGDLHLADSSYSRVKGFCENNQTLVNCIMNSCDVALEEAYSKVAFQVQLSSDLCRLWMAYGYADTEADVDFFYIIVTDPWLPSRACELAMSVWPHLAALRKHIHVTAHFSIKNLENAVRHFEMASEMCAGVHESSLKMSRFVREATCELPKKTLEMALAIFLEPVITPLALEEVCEPISVVAGYDQEVYSLMKLGYNGNLLEGRVIQKRGYSIGEDGGDVPHPFSPADIDKLIAPQINAIAAADAEGTRRPEITVGPAEFSRMVKASPQQS
jgi:hypothetical protein